MDLSRALAQWLFDQLQIVPASVVRQSLESPAIAGLLGRTFGQQEAEELQALLDQPARSGARKAAVLLPGTMGSLLSSTSGVGAMLWFNPTVLAHGHINLLELDDDGARDRVPDVEIQPVGIEKLAYLKLILTLTRESRLYEFPYDWRRHLEYNARRLHACLERWSQATPRRRFTLIGHSMGGLVALTYFALYPAESEQRVERLIMIGTPLLGAASTIEHFTGNSVPAQLVDRLHPGNDVRSLVKGMPSAYQLLPAPPELFPGARPYPVNWDLYQANDWPIGGLRQEYLDHARSGFEVLQLIDPQVERHAIAGCNHRTLTDLWCAMEETDSDPVPHYTPVHQEAGEDAGDDTVPLWSTRCKGVDTYYVEEHHQFLCSNDETMAAVIELLHEGVPALPEEPPPPRRLAKRLRLTPLAQQAAQLRDRLISGEFSREDVQRLFFPD